MEQEGCIYLGLNLSLLLTRSAEGTTELALEFTDLPFVVTIIIPSN